MFLDTSMEYRTFYKEGDITCDNLYNAIIMVEGVDVTACRKRCDYLKECKFFYYSYFSKEKSCVLFRSCNKFQSTSGSSGTTYTKIKRSNGLCR